MINLIWCAEFDGTKTAQLANLDKFDIASLSREDVSVPVPQSENNITPMIYLSLSSCDRNLPLACVGSGDVIFIFYFATRLTNAAINQSADSCCAVIAPQN